MKFILFFPGGQPDSNKDLRITASRGSEVERAVERAVGAGKVVIFEDGYVGALALTPHFAGYLYACDPPALHWLVYRDEPLRLTTRPPAAVVRQDLGPMPGVKRGRAK